MEKYRLTTKNNPYNPFTQWNDWYFFDLSKGYNTLFAYFNSIWKKAK